MSIQTDDTTDTGISDADAIASLTSALTAKASGAPAPAEDDEDDEDLEDELEGSDEDEDEDLEDDEDADEEEDEDDDAGAAQQASEVSDDTVVKVTVDGQEQELTVGSLKRLAGQEASLTRKSQEADYVGQRAAAVIQGALETVLEDLSTYEGVDWVLEGNRMDPEEFEWHRQQFASLSQRRDKLIAGARDLETTLQTRKEQQLRVQALEAVKVLSDPTTGIPGWNDDLYGQIMAYAVDQGLPSDDVATIVNPAVIKIINKARLHDAGQKATAQKVNLTPKNVRKGGGREAVPSKDRKSQQVLERKLRSGTASDADAMAALMGRWGVSKRG